MVEICQNMQQLDEISQNMQQSSFATNVDTLYSLAVHFIRNPGSTVGVADEDKPYLDWMEALVQDLFTASPM